MKFSAKTIIDNLTPYNGHLWSIHFPDDPQFNIFDAGGSIGKEIPAVSIQENLFSVNYDMVTIANGMTIPVPQYVSFLGDLNVNFWDKISSSDTLLLETALLDWVKEMQTSNGFKSLKTKGKVYKTVEVRKYNKEQDGVVRTSRYLCLPPTNLTFSPTGLPDLYTNSIQFPIISAEKIHDK